MKTSRATVPLKMIQMTLKKVTNITATSGTCRRWTEDKKRFGPNLICSFRTRKTFSKMGLMNEMKTPKTTVSVSLLKKTLILGVVIGLKV
jgi:hypothetical protein